MNSLKTVFAALGLVTIGVVAGYQWADHKGAHAEETGGMKMDHSQMDHSKMDHSAMGGMNAADPNATPATKAFMEANAKMHTDMSITYSGDADVDFVKSMIPHHQGAIDMANIVLKYGKDPEIKALAEGIVKAQDSEIAFMKGWLAKKAP